VTGAFPRAAAFDALAHPPLALPVVDGTVRYELRVPVEAAAQLMAGHYPGVPIMPGVLVVDCLCQLVAALYGDTVRVAAIERIRYLNPLFPGDELRLEVGLTEDPAGGVRVVARGWRSDGLPANEARLRLERGGVVDA
jgi:3-hydroxyacyl-[acyl-carrier-protein] dehydratase